MVFAGDAGVTGSGGGGDLRSSWQAQCPGFFGGGCPEECPISVLSDTLPYCTNACNAETPTGCSVGAICQDGQCAFGPCADGDVWTCPGDTACAALAHVCVPSDTSAPNCTPYLATEVLSCSFPCQVEQDLPGGNILCTSRCNDLDGCVAGFSCRTDLPPVDEFNFYPCIPNCFTVADCPGGLTCDELGQCSAY